MTKTNTPAKATTHFEQIPLVVVKQLTDEPALRIAREPGGAPAQATSTTIRRPRRAPRTA